MAVHASDAPLLVSFYVLPWILKDNIKIKLCIAPRMKLSYMYKYQKKEEKKNMRKTDKLIDILLSLYKVVEQLGSFS